MVDVKMRYGMHKYGEHPAFFSKNDVTMRSAYANVTNDLIKGDPTLYHLFTIGRLLQVTNASLADGAHRLEFPVVDFELQQRLTPKT